MDLDTAGLHKDAFRLHGKPLTFVRYPSQDGALEFLHDVCASEHGLGVLKGRSLSGKTTVVKQFIEELPAATAIAIIDCKDLDTSGFLTSILAQFGFELDAPSINEQMNFLKVFLVQQTSTNRAPLLFVDNAHKMDSIVIHCLWQLIKARCHAQNALRAVLISDGPLDAVADAKTTISHRKFDEYVMHPMTEAETSDYVISKLRAAGCNEPEEVMPWNLCEEIFQESEGYPGSVDRLMLLRLQEADELPLRSRHPGRLLAEAVGDVPVLLVTLNGKTLQQVKLDKPRVLIGRSDINDIIIDSSCMSRHHAMLVRQGAGLVLVDLNSTNGVFVNSKRVVSQMLHHDDVVSLGNHGIRVIDPISTQRGEPNQSLLDATDTVRSLSDIRRARTAR